MTIKQILLILSSTLLINGLIHAHDNKLVRKVSRYFGAELRMLKFEEDYNSEQQIEEEEKLFNTRNGKIYKDLELADTICGRLYPYPDQYDIRWNGDTCKQFRKSISKLSIDAVTELINSESEKYHNDYKPARENKIRASMKYDAALRMNSNIEKLQRQYNQQQEIITEEMISKVMNDGIIDYLDKEDIKAYPGDLPFSMDRSEIRDAIKKEMQEFTKNIVSKEGRKKIKNSILSRAQQHESLKDMRWKSGK